MDCDNKVIQFYPVGHPEFKFVGSRGGTSIPWISSLEMTKLLSEGCKGFLAAIVDSMAKPRLEDIAMVHDYPDVFPQELLGLPPE